MLRPYPFGQLPKTTRRSSVALRRCVRQLPRFNFNIARETAEKLLGTSISLKLGNLEWRERAELSDLLTEPIVAVALERGVGGPANQLFIDLSPQIVVVAVDRALGGQGEEAIGKGIFLLDELSQGVFAYIVARLLNATRSRFLLNSVITEKSAFQNAIGEEGVGVQPVEIVIGSAIGRLRLWIPFATANSFVADEASRVPYSLMGIELKLVAVAGDTRLNRAEVDALQPGDVVLLDRCGFFRQRGEWVGFVDVMIAGAKRTVWRCAAADRELRIESVSQSEEQTMGKGETQTLENPEQLMKLAGDAPIEVVVELSRFTLTLEEIGALRVGEVLSTGRPIGERVTLRAGGRAIASGELMDVEGEVGVRILSTGK
jgi:type III secretion protein Q